MTTPQSKPKAAESKLDDLDRQLDFIKRVLEIRAAQPNVSLAKAEVQARQDVAYQRGETPKFTRSDLDAMSAPEWKAVVDKFGVDIFADEPETAEERDERHRRGNLTDEEYAEMSAKLEQDYADKAFAKLVKQARAKQEADMLGAKARGESPEAIEQMYGRFDPYLNTLQGLPADAEAHRARTERVKAVEAAERQATKDWFKVGSDDDGEAE